MSRQELCLIHCFLPWTVMLSFSHRLVNMCWFNQNNFYVTAICWKVTYVPEFSPVFWAFFLTTSIIWRVVWLVTCFDQLDEDKLNKYRCEQNPGALLLRKLLFHFLSYPKRHNLICQSLCRCVSGLVAKWGQLDSLFEYSQWDRHKIQSIFEAIGPCCFLLT